MGISAKRTGTHRWGPSDALVLCCTIDLTVSWPLIWTMAWDRMWIARRLHRFVRTCSYGQVATPGALR